MTSRSRQSISQGVLARLNRDQDLEEEAAIVRAWCTPTASPDCDQVATHFKSTMTEICDTDMPKVRPQVNWWTSEMAQLRETCNRSRRVYTRCRRRRRRIPGEEEELRAIYINNKKALRMAICEAKAKEKNELCGLDNSLTKTFEPDLVTRVNQEPFLEPLNIAIPFMAYMSPEIPMVTDTEMFMVINHLKIKKNSPGPHGVPGIMLAIALKHLSQSPCDFLNVSLQTEQCLCISKKGSLKESLPYKPNALLTVFRQVFERIQFAHLTEHIDGRRVVVLRAATNDDLNMLINLLESPILRSIVTLHDSVGLLATQVAHHPSIIPGDFDITPAGDLALQTRNLYGTHEGDEEQRVPQVSPPQSLEFGSNSDNERILGLDSASVDSNMSPKQGRGILEMSRNDDSLASGSNNIVAGDWAQVEIINLVNDGTGLGFGIIGARTSGVIVKTILAGGVADRDGRLKSGDHILQIGDVSLMEMGSEQVAGVLRASGSRVRLVVARAVDPATSHASVAPIVPARLLSSPEALDRYLMEAGFEQVFHTQPTPLPVNSTATRFVFDKSITPPPESDAESPEVDRFTVQLKKDENGLGITIAGYVCEKEELSGIFVKSVTPGSAAALSGKVRVNDRIVAVDGVSLAGKSNQRAVDALKQSGNIVTLELERYLRGPKFEQLQQAIAAGESAAASVASVTSVPSVTGVAGVTSVGNNPFLHMHRADNSDSSEHHIQMTHLNTTSENSVDEVSESGRSSASTVHRPQTPFEMPRTPEQRDAIKKKWQAILGDDVEIVVGVVVRGGGGLGISLEGTVDVEGGREVRPHHYVRSVLPEGPVGRARVHRPGDELLEVNGHRLLGMNHLEVVSILKELSSEVCMVCARPRPAPALDLAPPAPTLVKAKSDGSLAGAGAGGEESGAVGKVRSRSLEPLTGLAMWASEPQIIELVKGERGLGFSILDYQDPLRPSQTLVVIRSLVPGGVAQQDGRLIPGDRLLFVNDQNLENASLEQAVAALKGAPRGVVRIGVAKPLPLADHPPPPPTTPPPSS